VPLVFIFFVVAPCAVGTRDLEAELLLVEVVATHVETDDADQDDAAAFAAHQA